MLKPSAAIAALLLIAPAAASAHPRDPSIVFEQPELKGVPGEFFVPSSAAEKHQYPKAPAFKLIFWQGNPFAANGELVPSTWDAGAKTGLDVGAVPKAQYSLQATGPSSTVQISGGEVGAYLNSADLAGSRFRADPAMMITPVIDLPNRNIFPFSTPTQRLYQSLKLRVPTAVSQNRPHNIVYLVSDFLFIDRTTGTRITFEVALFHHDRRSPRLTRDGLVRTEVGLSEHQELPGRQPLVAFVAPDRAGQGVGALCKPALAQAPAIRIHDQLAEFQDGAPQSEGEGRIRRVDESGGLCSAPVASQRRDAIRPVSD